MNPVWDRLKHFSPHSLVDQWGDPEKISTDLLLRIEAVRDFLGTPMIITSGYRAQDKNSQHSLGRAVDVVMPDWDKSALDLYFELERFSFPGLGLYRGWKYKDQDILGIHLDVRELGLKPNARWLGVRLGTVTQYHLFSWENFQRLGFMP